MTIDRTLDHATGVTSPKRAHPRPARPRSLLLAAALAASALIALTGTPAHAQVSDPLESVNRVIFSFNDKVDTYFLRRGGPIPGSGDRCPRVPRGGSDWCVPGAMGAERWDLWASLLHL